MSTFRVSIPVNTDEVEKLIPTGAYRGPKLYDAARGCVVLTFDTGRFETGLSNTNPKVLTVEELRGMAEGILPAGVLDRQVAVPAVPEQAVAPSAPSVAEPAEAAPAKPHKLKATKPR